MAGTPLLDIRHSKTKVGGMHLYHVIAGSGDRMVILHGLPETSHQWRKAMPNFAERFTVLVPD